VLIAILYFARTVVLPIAVACIVGMALKPAVQWFERWRIPPFLAAGFIMVIFLSATTCLFYYVARPAVLWANRAPEAGAAIREKIENTFHIHHREAPPPDSANADISRPAPLYVPDSQTTKTILAWSGATLAGVVETIVLTYLILISHGWFSKKLADTLAPRFGQHWVIETLDELRHKISRYLFSITLINAIFGVIIGAGVAAMGLPNAIMWGGIAALLNFIPYFGPILGMIVVGIVGLLAFDSMPGQILPFLLYFGMHVLEADLVTPYILGRRFTMHPLLIFVSLLFWTWLWGVPGAFLAVPLLVALKVACERHPPWSATGQLLTK